MYLRDVIILRINKLCEERSISINKLCTICGITQSTLANLKSRQTTNVTVLTIMRICRGLGISLQDFFSDPLFNINTMDDD